MGQALGLGPVLGMMFLVKAFESTPSVFVQASLSTLPVMMIPVAWALDGTRPSFQSGVFGILAVVLTAVLAMM